MVGSTKPLSQRFTHASKQRQACNHAEGHCSWRCRTWLRSKAWRCKCSPRNNILAYRKTSACAHFQKVLGPSGEHGPRAGNQQGNQWSCPVALMYWMMITDLSRKAASSAVEGPQHSRQLLRVLIQPQHHLGARLAA